MVSIFFSYGHLCEAGFLIVCPNSVQLKQQQQFHKLYLKYLRTAALPGNEFICTICPVSIFTLSLQVECFISLLADNVHSIGWPTIHIFLFLIHNGFTPLSFWVRDLHKDLNQAPIISRALFFMEWHHRFNLRIVLSTVHN